LSEKYILIVVLSFAADYPSYKGGYAPEPPAYGPAYAPEPPNYRTAYAPEPPAYPALSHRGPYPAEVEVVSFLSDIKFGQINDYSTKSANEFGLLAPSPKNAVF
jgi:hypothetical protein